MSIIATLVSPTVIKTSTTALTSTQSAPAIELKNSASVSQSYVHSLLDVVEDNPTDGSTLVYDAFSNKYIVKPIVVQLAGGVDGGNF